MLGAFAVLVVSACLRLRRPSRRESPLSLLLCCGAVVLWGAVAPDMPALLAAGVAIGMVYMALMALRPFAEIGLIAMAVTYLGSQYAFGARGDLAWQVVGVTVTNLALGVLLMSIRIVTERKVDEHTRSLAAANDRLEQLNRIDPLTGVANRRRLAEALDDVWAHAAGAREPISAIMVDVDYFKRYNDTYGHLVGDACLQRVASALSRSVRTGDIVARYGGEEFSVLLPDADLDAARRIAERVRTEIAGLEQEHATSPSGFVTVSIGVASAHPRGDSSAEELVRLADEGLYAAKHGGRNRIAVAAPRPTPTGRALEEFVCGRSDPVEVVEAAAGSALR